MVNNFTNINRFIMNVPDEGYTRNASCELNSISMFLLLSLG